MIWDGFDKRKFPRINVRCEIRITTSAEDPVFVTQTDNVGIGGVGVTLPKKMERFIPCRIRLELEKDRPWLESEGRIAWAVVTRKLKDRNLYCDTGIEFTNLDADGSRRLRAFLDEQTAVV